MSVRDAAGRHPRLVRGGPATDDPPHRRRPTHARPARGAARARENRPGRRDRTGPRDVGPFLICVVALAIAVAQSTVADSGGQSPLVVGAASSGLLTSALQYARGGPDLAVRADGAGDAPLRISVSLGRASATGLAAAAALRAEPLPPCIHADRPAARAGLGDWATTIVDTAFALPDRYRPPDLVPVGRAGIDGWGVVRALVIDDLRSLARDAAAAGNPLAVQSAYRSRARQAEVFAGWVASSGEAAARRFSARPGHSEHQLGTSLDLRAAAGGAPWSGAFGATAAGRWLARHAADYGFVLSYAAGAEALTCYGAEAWHVRYVGRRIAARVVASGLPLRAWLWRYGRSA